MRYCGKLARRHSHRSAAESGWREHYSGKPTTARAEKDAKDSKLTVNGPVFAVISIGDQHVSFYGSDGLVAKAPVSTGMARPPTPTGVFSIVQKQRWQRIEHL